MNMFSPGKKITDELAKEGELEVSQTSTSLSVADLGQLVVNIAALLPFSNLNLWALREHGSQLTPESLEWLNSVLCQAGGEAVRLNHEYLGTEHMLLALLADDARIGLHKEHFKALQTTPKKIRSKLLSCMYLDSPTILIHAPLPITPPLHEAIRQGIVIAEQLGQQNLGPQHQLFGLAITSSSVASEVLKKLGIDVDKIKRCFGWNN